MVITQLLERNARYHGHEIALVEINPTEERDNANTWKEASLIELAMPDAPYRRELTWEAFDKMSNRIANYFLAKDFAKGTKVGILMMNSLEWLPVYFGVLKAGCIAVPLNYRYTANEIKYCVDLADIEVLVFGPEFISRIDEIESEMPALKAKLFFGNTDETPSYAKDFMRLMGFYSNEPVPVELDENDIAAIYFSSGTTGFPKAILHRHKALLASCETEQAHHGQTRDDVFLCIPPLYHTGAKMHWFGSLLACSKTVLLRGIKPEWILRTVTEEKCTIVWLLVPWAQDILDAIDDGRIDLSEHLTQQWRLLHIGAQPVPPSLIKRWLKKFPNHEYDTNYGLSESLGPGCVHLGVENIDKVGAIGKAGYHWETKIIRPDGSEITEPNEVGELAVKGPGVMLGYYKNQEATDEILHGDWLWTGDMAKMDEAGFIYLVDRKKDVIISGGENLYPVQIEDYLRANDKIKDVAVIGLPDPRLGEIAAAIIELKPGEEASEEEINEFCNDLPRYKRPRKIIFADVPRNPTGKIEKPVLRERYNAVPLVEAQTLS